MGGPTSSGWEPAWAERAGLIFDTDRAVGPDRALRPRSVGGAYLRLPTPRALGRKHALWAGLRPGAEPRP